MEEIDLVKVVINDNFVVVVVVLLYIFIQYFRGCFCPELGQG